MKMTLSAFGHLDIEGQDYAHDVVIAHGKVHKRHKGPSKPYQARYGHTPLSAGEDLPWGGGRLYIGTGAYGALPVMPEVYAEARRRGVTVVARPTVELCQELADLQPKDINAVLHVTC